MNGKGLAITVVLVVVLAGVTGVGAYGLGVKAGLSQAQTIRGNFLAARGAGQGAGAPNGATGAGAGGNRQFNADNFASGQVKSINGGTIDLSTATSVVTIKLSSNTQIQKMAQGTPRDIQVGERITVQGAKASDGSLAAQSVQIGRGGAGPAASGAGPGASTTTGSTAGNAPASGPAN